MAAAPARADTPLWELNLSPTVAFGPSLSYTLACARRWQLDLHGSARAVFTVERKPGAIGWTPIPELHLATNFGSGIGMSWAFKESAALAPDGS